MYVTAMSHRSQISQRTGSNHHSCVSHQSLMFCCCWLVCDQLSEEHPEETDTDRAAGYNAVHLSVVFSFSA